MSEKTMPDPMWSGLDVASGDSVGTIAFRGRDRAAGMETYLTLHGDGTWTATPDGLQKVADMINRASRMNWKRVADEMPPTAVGTRVVLRTNEDVYALIRMSADGWMFTPAVGDAMRVTWLNGIWTHWLPIEPPAGEP